MRHDSLRSGFARPLVLLFSLLILYPSWGDARDEALSDADKLFGLSLLWQEVNYNFAFFDQVPDLDWDEAYRSFIPEVLDTTNTYEYYKELQRFMALLEDGHTNVYLPESLWREHERYAPWLEVRPVGDNFLIANRGRRLGQKIPRGATVVAVDQMPVPVYLEREILPYVAASTPQARQVFAAMWLLAGGPGTEMEVTLEHPETGRFDVSLIREQMLWGDEHVREDQWVADAEREPFAFRWLEDGVAYVALNSFATDAVVSEFAARESELRKARGLVIDLRNNGGGNSGYGYQIVSWLTDTTLATSRWRTRKHIAAYKAWGHWDEAHRSYTRMDAWFDGGSHGEVTPNASAGPIIVPTTVLIGANTGSAAEDFLVAVDSLSHVTTVGEPTAGSTGQPLMFDLPGGGQARVVTKRDTYPDGRDFVGVGVIPEVPVSPSVEDFRAGRDPVLERGRTLLAP